MQFSIRKTDGVRLSLQNPFPIFRRRKVTAKSKISQKYFFFLFFVAVFAYLLLPWNRFYTYCLQSSVSRYSHLLLNLFFFENIGGSFLFLSCSDPWLQKIKDVGIHPFYQRKWKEELSFIWLSVTATCNFCFTFVSVPLLPRPVAGKTHLRVPCKEVSYLWIYLYMQCNCLSLKW